MGFLDFLNGESGNTDKGSTPNSGGNSQGSGDVKAAFDPSTGQTNNYFDGVGKADGPGHGHIRVDESGTPSIVRGSYEPGQANARRDATELETPSKGSQQG